MVTIYFLQPVLVANLETYHGNGNQFKNVQTVMLTNLKMSNR